MARPNATPQKWGKKIEAARSAAQDEGWKIGHAAALLQMLGEHVNDVADQDLGDRLGYLASQINLHMAALEAQLHKIEHAVMALERNDASEPAADDADKVVHLTRPDGGAA